MMNIQRLRVKSFNFQKFGLYIILLCLIIAFGNCSKKKNRYKNAVHLLELNQSNISVIPEPVDSPKMQRVRGDTLKAVKLELQDLKVFKRGEPISEEKKENLGYGREKAVFFCVDQLVNPSHADAWNRYLYPKKYIPYYHKQIWKPQHQGEDMRNWFKFQIPIPDTLFEHGFFIHKDYYVAIFENSQFQSIDRISGFWGRATGANLHLYIGLEKNGLKDAWNNSYTKLYIISNSQSEFERFIGVNLKTTTQFKSDSIISAAAKFIYKRPKVIIKIWSGIDTLSSFNRFKDRIENSFNIEVFVGDFTGDNRNDFILNAGRKKADKFLGDSFTMVFESGGVLPQFIKSSEFEQVIRSDDTYLLMLRYWTPDTGIWGWTIYEGKVNEKLKFIFSESDYST
jgi:hypothetical protein